MNQKKITIIMIVIIIWLTTILVVLNNANKRSEERLQKIKLEYQHLTLLPQSDQNELIRIYNLRHDLQRLFPDKKNGINEMKGWTLEQWAEEFGHKEYKSLKKYRIEVSKNYIYEKYLPIELALEEASSYTYEDNKYNCIDFSENLQELLEDINIESSLIVGYGPDYHQWLAIWIEPQGGRFITIEENYEFEKVVKKDHWGNKR